MEWNFIEKLQWFEEPPSVPGFYLFMGNSQAEDEYYPHVQLVTIGYDGEADCDEWATNGPPGIVYSDALAGEKGRWALLKEI